MMIMTTKIETISLALTLRPSRCSQNGRDEAGLSSVISGEGSLELSVSSMDGHRNFCEPGFGFVECRDVNFLFGEDRQVLRRQAEDGKTERDKHRGDDYLGPLGGVTTAAGGLATAGTRSKA